MAAKFGGDVYPLLVILDGFESSVLVLIRQRAFVITHDQKNPDILISCILLKCVYISLRRGLTEDIHQLDGVNSEGVAGNPGEIKHTNQMTVDGPMKRPGGQ